MALSDKLINGESLNMFAKKLNDKIKNEVKEMLGGKFLRYVTQDEYDALTDDEKNNPEIVWNIVDPDIPGSGVSSGSNNVEEEELGTLLDSIFGNNNN